MFHTPTLCGARPAPVEVCGQVLVGRQTFFEGSTRREAKIKKSSFSVFLSVSVCLSVSGVAEHPRRTNVEVPQGAGQIMTRRTFRAPCDTPLLFG